MPIYFKTPSECGNDFLTYLDAQDDSINPAQKDSDHWIRSRAYGGVASGVHADAQLVRDDAFPQSARADALEKWLFALFKSGFRPAEQARGPVEMSGCLPGEHLPIASEFLHLPTGNTYLTLSDSVVDGDGDLTVEVKSVDVGQAQNLFADAPLQLSQPPSGFSATGRVGATNIADGRDPETPDQARQRILDRFRQPIKGGTVSDYRQYARDADPSVIAASVIRFYRGLGTMGVLITSGTSDIDKAVNGDQAIVLIPSDALVLLVDDYLNSVNPNTDIAFSIKPTLLPTAALASVRFSSGDAATVVDDPLNPGAAITQGDMVKREMKRAIYKTGLGGRKIAGATAGFVYVSDIEQTIDANLADTPEAQGSIAQIVADRQVSITGGAPNLAVGGLYIPVPGVLTVGAL